MDADASFAQEIALHMLLPSAISQSHPNILALQSQILFAFSPFQHCLQISPPSLLSFSGISYARAALRAMIFFWMNKKVSRMTMAPMMQNTSTTPGSLAAQFLRFMSWWNSASLRAMRDLSKAAILSNVEFFGFRDLLTKLLKQLSSGRSYSSGMSLKLEMGNRRGCRGESVEIELKVL